MSLITMYNIFIFFNLMLHFWKKKHTLLNNVWRNFYFSYFILSMFIERKKRAQIFCPRTWCTKKTFRLSSHTPGYSLKSCPGQLLMKQSVKQNKKISLKKIKIKSIWTCPGHDYNLYPGLWPDNRKVFSYTRSFDQIFERFLVSFKKHYI